MVEGMEAHGILVAIALGMMGIVFWVVKSMITKLENKVDEVEGTMIGEFSTCHVNRRDILKELMTTDQHILVCRATQAEFKLHVSETARKNREHFDKMLKEAMMSLTRTIEKNGHIK